MFPRSVPPQVLQLEERFVANYLGELFGTPLVDLTPAFLGQPSPLSFPGPGPQYGVAAESLHSPDSSVRGLVKHVSLDRVVIATYAPLGVEAHASDSLRARFTDGVGTFPGSANWQSIETSFDPLSSRLAATSPIALHGYAAQIPGYLFRGEGLTSAPTEQGVYGLLGDRGPSSPVLDQPGKIEELSYSSRSGWIATSLGSLLSAENNPAETDSQNPARVVTRLNSKSALALTAVSMRGSTKIDVLRSPPTGGSTGPNGGCQRVANDWNPDAIELPPSNYNTQVVVQQAGYYNWDRTFPTFPSIANVLVAPPIYPDAPYQFNTEYGGFYATSLISPLCQQFVSLSFASAGVYSVRVMFSDSSSYTILLYADAVEHGGFRKGRPVKIPVPVAQPSRAVFVNPEFAPPYPVDYDVFNRAGMQPFTRNTLDDAVAEFQRIWTFYLSGMDIVLDGHGANSYFQFNGAAESMQDNNANTMRFIDGLNSKVHNIIHSVYFAACSVAEDLSTQNHIMHVMADTFGYPYLIDRPTYGWNVTLYSISASTFRNAYFAAANGGILYVVHTTGTA